MKDPYAHQASGSNYIQLNWKISIFIMLSILSRSTIGRGLSGILPKGRGGRTFNEVTRLIFYFFLFFFCDYMFCYIDYMVNVLDSSHNNNILDLVLLLLLQVWVAGMQFCLVAFVLLQARMMNHSFCCNLDIDEFLCRDVL